MKIYLVDFENVKSKGLQGIDNLTETDTVIIFYSENSDTINFEMHQKVLTSKADLEYFKVNVGGKNALDFQLSTLLGYLVAMILIRIFLLSAMTEVLTFFMISGTVSMLIAQMLWSTELGQYKPLLISLIIRLIRPKTMKMKMKNRLNI
ncbi:MAG: PIN domain-containing protein [Ruminococcus bicirculans (ex Wegman et al. 2014)]